MFQAGDQLRLERALTVDLYESIEGLLRTRIEQQGLMKLQQRQPCSVLLQFDLTQHDMRPGGLTGYGQSTPGDGARSFIIAATGEYARIEQQGIQVRRFLAHYCGSFLSSFSILRRSIFGLGYREKGRTIGRILAQGRLPLGERAGFITFTSVHLSQNKVSSGRILSLGDGFTGFKRRMIQVSFYQGDLGFEHGQRGRIEFGPVSIQMNSRDFGSRCRSAVAQGFNGKLFRSIQVCLDDAGEGALLGVWDTA